MIANGSVHSIVFGAVGRHDEQPPVLALVFPGLVELGLGEFLG